MMEPPGPGQPLGPQPGLFLIYSEMALAGVGEVGELYLRSHHLALGYLGDETLTQQKFLSNPFSTISGDMLYRTGDLGRYLPDGNAEFVGRMDDQVQIRGFRVELGEIEAALARHPAIQDAVVIFVESRTGPGSQLVAFFT